MSWRSRTHPSGIKTPACPSRGWRLPENAAGSASTKSPCSKPWEGFLLAAGSPRWQCPLLPLAALGSTQAAGAVAAGLPWLAQQAWLGWMLQLLGFSGLSCHCLFWPFPAAVVAVRVMGEACGSVTDCGEPKTSPLWKSALSRTVIRLFGHRQKKMLQLWFSWVELLLFAAFQQRGLKVCGLGLALIKAFFVLWGINI